MIRTPAQIIRDFRRGKKGFTLIEVILASALFTTVTMIGVMVFTDVARIQRRIYLESALIEDGRFLMERITREIRQNTIDYDEYYNRLVSGGKFGQFFGCYASRFYNPGKDLLLGAKCSAPAAAKGLSPLSYPGCVIDKGTLDINTGQNPYMGINKINKKAADANAFCDLNFLPSGGCTIDSSLNKRDQLYLIDSKGSQKTIFARKKINNSPDEYALSILRLRGVDNNKDGLAETWFDSEPTPTNFYCAPGFDCATANFAPTYKLDDSLDASGTNSGKLWQGFVPISPLRSNIKSLTFYVSPLEDPRKAFAETKLTDAILQQPHVTVVLTLEPAKSQLAGLVGAPPLLTLQTSVTSRVYNEVRSYVGGTCLLY